MPRTHARPHVAVAVTVTVAQGQTGAATQIKTCGAYFATDRPDRQSAPHPYPQADAPDPNNE
jgi:hypothetical protein